MMFEKIKEKRANKKISKLESERFQNSTTAEQLDLLLKKQKETVDWKIQINMDDDPDALERRARIDALKSRLGK